MNTFGRRLSPRGFLRPRRMGKLARNALIFYLLSRPLTRAVNPRRAQLRHRYVPRQGLLGILMGVWRSL